MSALLDQPWPGSSALEPASPQAQHIADLWWLFFWISAAVWALVITVTVLAVWRRRRGPRALEPVAEPGPEPPLRIVTGGAGIATLLTLLLLLVASVRTGRDLATSTPADALRIEITGQRWWWQIRYPGERPSQMVTTANELRVPVGRAVSLKLSSRDVIHSLWVPELHGKRDLIPGNPSELSFVAARAGTFRGQCAEFCGLQHAHMGLIVIAEPPERFEAWLAAQRAPAASPPDALAQRGQQVFLGSSCPMCHSVQGTQAAGSVGPDLTHVASRTTLAAATLPNTPTELVSWVRDPQTIKLGTLMPTHRIEPAADEAPLIAYLLSLK